MTTITQAIRLNKTTLLSVQGLVTTHVKEGDIFEVVEKEFLVGGAYNITLRKISKRIRK